MSKLLFSAAIPNKRQHLWLNSGWFLPVEDCARLNLGYLDPSQIKVENWKDREEEGILYVPKAGEILYRLKP